jgi:lysophospholipase L1-like esterase
MHINGRQRYSFGLFVTVIALNAFSLTFAGCNKEHDSYTTTVSGNGQTDTSQANKISYLALGDSYTIGQGVSESDRFPEQLTARLATRGVQKPEIIAATGWTTQNLLQAIQAKNPASNFRIVSLLIGVNNQYQQRDTMGYREQFRLCLSKAVELAMGDKRRVFVLSIPDYSVTPFGQNQTPALIASQIDQYNAINKEVTASFGISYTDITPVSRMALNDQTLTAGDGLHPSGKQYSLWVEQLAPKIAELLK